MASGHIIHLHGDRHQEAQLLLPWYVTGRLDPADQAQVEAHLSQCQQCQAELKLEQKLGVGCADLPMDVEQGWAAMQRRLAPDRPTPALSVRLGAWLSRAWRTGPPWLGWALGAQLVLLLAAGVVLTPSLQPTRYHVLGAAPPPAAGNLVVIFRPDTQEQALRQTLNANHARLVDGPTAADAYLLHVPVAERAAVLARLRARSDIVLAQPIDSGGAP